MDEKKKIGIIGCGWLGAKLLARLHSAYEVHVTCRSPAGAAKLAAMASSVITVHFDHTKIEALARWPISPALDAIVIMVPFSLQRSTLEENQIKLKNLFAFIGDFRGQLLFTSSTGVYPSHPLMYQETDLPVEANPLEHAVKSRYTQANILRLGGLMGGDRLLRKYRPKDLDSPVNHIHYEDACLVIIKLVEGKLDGALFNVVAPLHPSKKAVLAAQVGDTAQAPIVPEGRVILSDRLITDLDFEFTYPDPASFHLPPTEGSAKESP